MIPYDDLVAALQNWRLRQGLSIAQTALPIAQPQVQSAPVAPRTTPPPQPPRSAPMAAQRPAPPPLAPAELDVDDAALLDEAHYDNDGDDFAMAFGQLEKQDEATAIGAAPAPRPSELTDPSADLPPPPRRGRNW